MTEILPKPVLNSITNGIGAGFVSYVLIKVVSGRSREVHPLLWWVVALFGVYFGIGPIQAALVG